MSDKPNFLQILMSQDKRLKNKPIAKRFSTLEISNEHTEIAKDTLERLDSLCNENNNDSQKTTEDCTNEVINILSEFDEIDKILSAVEPVDFCPEAIDDQHINEAKPGTSEKLREDVKEANEKILKLKKILKYLEKMPADGEKEIKYIERAKKYINHVLNSEKGRRKEEKVKKEKTPNENKLDVKIEKQKKRKSSSKKNYIDQGKKTNENNDIENNSEAVETELMIKINSIKTKLLELEEKLPVNSQKIGQSMKRGYLENFKKLSNDLTNLDVKEYENAIKFKYDTLEKIQDCINYLEK